MWSHNLSGSGKSNHLGIRLEKHLNRWRALREGSSSVDSSRVPYKLYTQGDSFKRSYKQNFTAGWRSLLWYTRMTPQQTNRQCQVRK